MYQILVYAYYIHLCESTDWLSDRSLRTQAMEFSFLCESKTHTTSGKSQAVVDASVVLDMEVNIERIM
jgi:hypothetical protein